MAMFAVADIAYAQFSLPQPVSLTVTPSSLSPGATVVIRAETPLFEPSAAVFKWTIDGRARPDISGIGKNEIQLTTGVIGTSIRVIVAVTDPSGTQGTASFTIPVSDLALSWFAETYVPKWYKGKALPVGDSVVDIAAFPNVVLGGKQIPPENLVYQWSLDDQDRALVGLGKRVFRIRTSDLPKTTHNIHVVVEDTNKRVRQEGEIFIEPTSPRAVIYPVSPLGGIEPRSASLFQPNRETSDFQVEPFFFPVESKRNLTYEWSVGAQSIEGTPENPWAITLHSLIQQVFSTILSAAITDPVTSLSSVSQQVTIFLQ
ncbi:MAG: hypothetical protein G01um101433_787 [Parcubacteria group bacterium Gr01-1014_33]|nr:MAG: hypothetical protein G01um101433_787 [Parcubacteria group bacterium Gr01-1014_33]